MSFLRLIYLAHRFGTSLKKRGFIAFTRIVAILSIAIGCMALLLSMAILDGFKQALEDNAVKFTAHIRVQSFNGDIPPPMPEHLIKHPAIASFEIALQKEGLLRKRGGDIDGILLKGIDDETEFIARPKELRKSMGFQVADTAIITSMIPDPGGSSIPLPVTMKAKIRGLFKTGMSQYDELYVFLPRMTLSQLLGTSTDAKSHYELMVKPGFDINAIGTKIQDQVPYPLFVQTVYDLHAGMFHWIELQKEPIPIVLSLIGIVAIMNILTSLLIIVIEKTRSIGVLKSLGMKQFSIMTIFSLQGIALGIIGITIGCLGSFALCTIQQNYGIITLNADLYFIDILPVTMKAWHYYLVGGSALALSLFATIIPAFVASRISPTKAMLFK
jgi:lipoprotein-releasing system permease protein